MTDDKLRPLEARVKKLEAKVGGRGWGCLLIVFALGWQTAWGTGTIWLKPPWIPDRVTVDEWGDKMGAKAGQRE